VARRSNQPKLDSPTARKKLSASESVYWNTISRGCSFGYRRSDNSRAGVWKVKYVPPKDAGGNATGRRIQETIATADDMLPPDGVTVLSYEQARKKANEWFPTALQKATGLVPHRRDYTVEDACNDYLNALEGRKPTYVPRKVINAVVVPALGKVAVEKLTRARIEQWLKEIAEKPRRKPRQGLKPDDDEAKRRRKDSANRYLTILRAALTRALADGKVACSGIAWKSVKPFAQVDQRRTRFLSDDEARKIVDKCGRDFGLLVRAALFSGCRYGELARVLISDFDAGAGTLFVSHSKSGKPRQVYLDPEAIQFFTAMCDKRRRNDFVFADGGKRWKKDSAKGLMEEACKAAEIEPLTFHELRHSAASRWARQGLSLAEIAQQLGHADIRMTQRYAHLCQQTLANKVRRMPAMGIYAIVPQPEPQPEAQPQTDKIQ
jgi:integrase